MSFFRYASERISQQFAPYRGRSKHCYVKPVNKRVTYFLDSAFIGGTTDRRLLLKAVGDGWPFTPDAVSGAMTPTLDNPAVLGLQ